MFEARVTKSSPMNNLETNEEETIREWYLFPELRHTSTNYLRLKKGIYWLFKINIVNIITEYQKIINLLDDITNRPFKFRTRNWAEINDE